eukprot:5173028-Prymnesium_polylepis.1
MSRVTEQRILPRRASFGKQTRSNIMRRDVRNGFLIPAAVRAVAVLECIVYWVVLFVAPSSYDTTTVYFQPKVSTSSSKGQTRKST